MTHRPGPDVAGIPDTLSDVARHGTKRSDAACSEGTSSRCAAERPAESRNGKEKKMTTALKMAGFDGETLEIIAFRLHDQEFCVKTTTIREIRGWAPSTPIPHSPAEVLGVMNLRGTVIPIIDLAHKLGMKSTVANERSAIVVAEVHNMVIGLVVDRVSDILTVQGNQVQPVPEITTSFDKSYAEGIIANETGMICFLNLARMFKDREMDDIAA
jgi:purine-binding chemotaxis protein CheW